MKAKQIITEAMGDDPTQAPGGPAKPPPRGSLERPSATERSGPGRPGAGRPGEPPGFLNARERSLLKDILLGELLQMSGNDSFYAGLVAAAINGKDPEPAHVKHLLDEFGKFPQSLFNEQHHALLNKLASAQG